jgi:hypothetical protein
MTQLVGLDPQGFACRLQQQLLGQGNRRWSCGGVLQLLSQLVLERIAPAKGATISETRLNSSQDDL